MVLVCSLLWCPVRAEFVSLKLARLVAFANLLYLSLLTNLIIAIGFFCTGHSTLGTIALFWNLVYRFLSLAYSGEPMMEEPIWAQLRKSFK